GAARPPAPGRGGGPKPDHDGRETGHRRDYREHEDGELALVLLGGSALDDLDVRAGHHEEGEDQVNRDGGVPANEDAGRAAPAVRQRQGAGDEDPERARGEEAGPRLYDAQHERGSIARLLSRRHARP